MKKFNNRGITLMEIVVYMACLSIIIALMSSFFKLFNASLNRSLANGQAKANKITTQVNTAVNQYATLGQLEAAKTQWLIVYLPNLRECKKGDAQYWVARTNTREVTLYTDSSCTRSVGTLNALDNPTFENDTTKTSWGVSGGNITNPNNLRVRLIVFP